ncbi:YolD-like family protein [Bacillus sp. FSL K6-3431]|uniref:YolD-like family protein n=1 Tax=Bacillus sp. FSL K6-3431 TaxID=2921500 RepID=UPI0030F5CF12
MKINKLTPGYNLRWESSRMVLPEHKEQILSHGLDKGRTKKPTLDEDQLQDIDEKIHTAIGFHYIVKFTLWIDGFIKELIGYIHFIDVINRHVRIKDLKDEVHRIDNESIVEVDFVD